MHRGPSTEALEMSRDSLPLHQGTWDFSRAGRPLRLPPQLRPVAWIALATILCAIARLSFTVFCRPFAAAPLRAGLLATCVIAIDANFKWAAAGCIKHEAIGEVLAQQR